MENPWEFAECVAKRVAAANQVNAKVESVTESQGGYLITLFVKERRPQVVTEVYPQGGPQE